MYIIINANDKFIRKECRCTSGCFEKKAQQSITNELTVEEREMANNDIENDVNELSHCIDAIENSKLLTAVDAGTNAFNAIKQKSTLCHRIFEMIQKFAKDVVSITTSISNMDASAILDKIKDGSILKAIGLSKYMKQFAEGCQCIMNKVIELFQGAAGKLSLLWRSLSHAKDVMVNSLGEVVNAKSLCNEANEKAEKLKRMTTSLCNIDAIMLVKSLGGEKSRSMNAMGTARDLDVGMGEAVLKMKKAASMVGDEYHNLPSIITDGITDESDDNGEDEDVRSLGTNIRDIDIDIKELETVTKTIEDSNILHAAKTIHKEMSTLPEKVDRCNDMVQSCTDFADRSKLSIDSFLGKWSLETAILHIKEMCRLVSFSKLMETLADQIHKLVKAITSLLSVMSAKLQMIAEQVGFDSVVDAAGGLGDMVSDGLNDMMGKMFGKD